MNFGIRNLRDTEYSRRVCREAAEGVRCCTSKGRLKETPIRIEIDRLDMERFRKSMHSLR